MAFSQRARSWRARFSFPNGSAPTTFKYRGLKPLAQREGHMSIQSRRSATQWMPSVEGKYNFLEGEWMMSEFSTHAQRNSDKTSNAEWNQDEFLAVVSHELLNPTWVILGWTDIIAKKLIEVDTLSRAVEMIKRSAQLQVHLINQLMDFSRINSANLRLETQHVALVPVLETAIETMTPQAMAKSIELSADFEGSAASVIGDPVRLQQVFTNLLSNSIKFTPHGGHVDVWSIRDGSNVEINVSDKIGRAHV